ncbi:MAG: type III pantothenate kinase, partial [Verrucomicrobia bacterium]|nr:type III pantothenate kinase [Verrucomicrobiota bacterium]
MKPRPPRTLLLCLGNSSLFGGVAVGLAPLRPFRLPPHKLPRTRGRLDHVALCSVVPARTSTLVTWCETHLRLTPSVLTVRNAPGLSIGYREPTQLGTDRLAAALGARARHPGKNIIIVDAGTATTVTALRRDGHLLGGAWTHVPGGYAGRKDAQVMAVCDIRRSRREAAVHAVNTIYAERFGQATYNGCVGYNDFRELLARD